MNSKLESVLIHVFSLLKTDITDYCDLETVDGNYTLVAQDGSLASIIQFDGSRSVLAADTFESLIDRLDEAFAIHFKNRGHQLQVIFRRDLDARPMLEHNAMQQHATAERLHLDIHDLIDESTEKYVQYVYAEECYLVFWSRPVLLDAIEVKLYRDSINEFRKSSNWPACRDAQNLLRPISYLYDRHLSFVYKLRDDLSSPEFGCSVELLDIASALRAIRMSVYPDITSPNWEAAVPGTKIPFRWKSNSKLDDLSEFLYPTLPQQIMTANAEIGHDRNPQLPDATMVRVGSRAYAPVVMIIPPREPKYFSALFNALNNTETKENGVTRAIPYTISFMIESDGMSVMTFKSIFSGLLSFSSEINRNINAAKQALAAYRGAGGCVVKFRMTAMTWSSLDAASVKELTLRKSKMIKALEGWGGLEVSEHTGNPLLAFQSNAAALTTCHIGAPCPAPLREALSVLPLVRPASPFAKGSIIFRSLDGKILRYQRFSSEQTTWITLIAGKPGSGKSVLMNYNNVECCLMPGIANLPYIGIIDIGVSSSGFIELIRDSLPEDKRHLAVYKRLQNTTGDCINPMDTPLGLRAPLAKDREFIKNFLVTLVTPPERSLPYDGMSTFVGRVIDIAYKSKNPDFEQSQAETYKPGHNKVIDEAVQKIDFTVYPATTYWELVDAFFVAGMIYEAEVTQRYAVPVLNELLAVTNSEAIKSEYGEDEEGERLIIAFRRGVREAIGDFPIFSSYTRFDIGSARIISLDLQDVALAGSAAAHKQTALMYMIARQSFLKKIAFSKEDLPYFPPLYKAYYDKLVNDIIDENKVLCMDEVHKTGRHPGLQLQLLEDGREARKWNLEIILASQLMEDFGKLFEIATSIFILDSGTPKTRKWLADNIGLQPVEDIALRSFVRGPSTHGATFLARFQTKTAEYSQLFTLSSGAMRLWALSTTAEDRKLRTLLYEAIPRPAARKILAYEYPGGSCKKVIEKKKEEEFRGVTEIDEKMLDSVIEREAKRLISEYYKRGNF